MFPEPAKNRPSKWLFRVCLGFSIAIATGCSSKNLVKPDQGRLIGSAGMNQIEGSGGSGLANWATISGYGTRDSFGVSAFHSQVILKDFSLQSSGGSVGIVDRVELSYARQKFDLEDEGRNLGLEDTKLEQDIFGAKLRLLGDAMYDQDKLLPQISVGMQYKRTAQEEFALSMGAEKDEGVDLYIAATKVLLDHNLVLNATLRGTKANQMGLLGFGGPNGGYAPQFEGSVVYMIRRNLMIGADYRTKPNNLETVSEDDAKALFLSWFPSKNFAISGALVDMGTIAEQETQRGVMGAVQVGF